LKFYILFWWKHYHFNFSWNIVGDVKITTLSIQQFFSTKVDWNWLWLILIVIVIRFFFRITNVFFVKVFLGWYKIFFFSLNLLKLFSIDISWNCFSNNDIDQDYLSKWFSWPTLSLLFSNRLQLRFFFYRLHSKYFWIDVRQDFF